MIPNDVAVNQEQPLNDQILITIDENSASSTSSTSAVSNYTNSSSSSSSRPNIAATRASIPSPLNSNSSSFSSEPNIPATCVSGNFDSTTNSSNLSSSSAFSSFLSLSSNSFASIPKTSIASSGEETRYRTRKSSLNVERSERKIQKIGRR